VGKFTLLASRIVGFVGIVAVNYQSGGEGGAVMPVEMFTMKRGIGISPLLLV